jgi:hypothetical protein
MVEIVDADKCSVNRPVPVISVEEIVKPDIECGGRYWYSPVRFAVMSLRYNNKKRVEAIKLANFGLTPFWVDRVACISIDINHFVDAGI